MRNLFVIGGGLIGGALYGALTSTSGGSPAPPRSGAPGSNPLKRIVGFILVLAAGLFLTMAFIHFRDTWKLAHREPQVVTAAELRRPGDPNSLTGRWLAYTFEESKPTELTVTRRRLGQGGDVEAGVLLVRVQDTWLVATVTPGFKGKQLVGRLLPSESLQGQDLIERTRQIEPKSSALLPYEFNAVDATANDENVFYLRAGIFAVLGLLGLLFGLRLLCGGRRPVPSSAPAATNGSSYQILSNR
jgi:hypothetical protein